MASFIASLQCFYFSDGYIAYWENIECSADGSLTKFLKEQLADKGWQIAEAWARDALICRIEQLPGGLFDCSSGCPREVDRVA